MQVPHNHFKIYYNSQLPYFHSNEPKTLSALLVAPGPGRLKEA